MFCLFRGKWTISAIKIDVLLIALRAVTVQLTGNLISHLRLARCQFWETFCDSPELGLGRRAFRNDKERWSGFMIC